MTKNNETPERIVTRHYSNGIISAQPSEKGFFLKESNAVFVGEYIRRDVSDAAVEAAKPKVYELAKVMAEVLNGGEFDSPQWYNGSQRKLWRDRASAILSALQ